MGRWVQSQRGQALILVAFALIGVLAFVGLAIDGGTLFLHRRRVQNASDSGAMAGTRALYYEQQVLPVVEEVILQEIHTLAESNDVPDTNGTPGDDVNDNVVAYYTDIDGERLLGEGGEPVVSWGPLPGREGL